jgi:rhodanese-related sulfurtransferase
VAVEALGVGYYTDAHLPGAINIPVGHVDALAARLLPDRQAPIVVYCTGGGASSDAVAHRLEALGYAAVAVYLGGKEDWVEHGLPWNACRRRRMRSPTPSRLRKVQHRPTQGGQRSLPISSRSGRSVHPARHI